MKRLQPVGIDQIYQEQLSTLVKSSKNTILDLDEKELKPDSFIGNTIVNYKIEQLLDVTDEWRDYKALHLIKTKPYFLRIIQPEYSTSTNFRMRFRKETLVGARLNHKNIFPLTDAGMFQDCFYLAKKYRECIKLDNLIKQNQKLEPKVAVNVGIQLSNALQYVHQNKIIHRNINPGNIYVDVDGYVLLSDFGFSTSFAQHQDEVELESVKDVKQFLYQAPELGLTPPEATESSDIYSVCSVLFFVVTGEPPYKSIQDKLFGKRQNLKELDPNIPTKLISIIEKGISDNSEERFGKASQLSVALKE